MSYRVKALDPSHDVHNFDCGKAVLNDWLKNTARQHHKNGTSRTFVLVDEDQPQIILGFMTLALRGLMASEELPRDISRKLPKNVSGYTIARLAVSRKHHRKGFGEELLLSAMEKVKAAASEVSGFGLFVDAKDGDAMEFYKKFGFLPFPSNPLLMVMPIAAIPSSD